MTDQDGISFLAAGRRILCSLKERRESERREKKRKRESEKREKRERKRFGNGHHKRIHPALFFLCEKY